MTTVEEIVIDIQSGADRKNELYTAVYKFLYALCAKYLRFASEQGCELDDLMSAAWIGAEKAINDFNLDKGYKYITYLKYHVNNAICDFLGIRNGRKVRQHISLDEEVPGTDGITYGDTIEDVSSAMCFERAENDEYYKALIEEVERLPTEISCTVKQYFFDGETIESIADTMNVENEAVKKYKRKALDMLRKNKRIKEWYYEDVAYIRISSKTFNTTWTSSTEWAALKVLNEKT